MAISPGNILSFEITKRESVSGDLSWTSSNQLNWPFLDLRGPGGQFEPMKALIKPTVIQSHL
jgi:hypothetical protein